MSGMGSHQHLAAELVPDEKQFVLIVMCHLFFWTKQNIFHLRPVLPPAYDAPNWRRASQKRSIPIDQKAWHQSTSWSVVENPNYVITVASCKVRSPKKSSWIFWCDPFFQLNSMMALAGTLSWTDASPISYLAKILWEFCCRVNLIMTNSSVFNRSPLQCNLWSLIPTWFMFKASIAVGNSYSRWMVKVQDGSKVLSRQLQRVKTNWGINFL